MTTSDQKRLALRPVIATEPAQNPAEKFQNEVWRPILKYQHDRLEALFQQHISKYRIDLSSMPETDRKRYVGKMFQKDVPLRNQLLGVIFGLMTAEEWQLFVTMEKDLSRRLHDLLIQRIQSML
ncbi:glyoxalase [Arundinibacter roseus]|uniref:Glyoxalase n=1 Tax=Arundinibacter roseus TaxID=2070510 RepID=A0A4R4K8R9_9BACT|nr:glyoxalase [Arundinibacter roseus]TDB63990.1 glyoxalase [Arundinibacter roseus]